MSVERLTHVDPDALLCALIVAPGVYSRNRFFDLFEQATTKRVRRRAARVRGIIRQLTSQGSEIVGEQVLEDGRVLLRYRIAGLSFSRSTALSALEAASLRFALHRARSAPLSGGDRLLVEQALSRLSENGASESSSPQ